MINERRGNKWERKKAKKAKRKERSERERQREREKRCVSIQTFKSMNV